MSDSADAKAQRSLARLLDIMRRLRDPANGCPWDREQDFASIAPYTIEEAYEVAEAIAHGEPGALEAELGDLLFQVVFHAQMGAERQWFDFASVADAIASKLTERHPHVFADARIDSAAEQNRAWEEHKARERAARGESGASELADVPLALPALSRAAKLGKRAGRVGFDWPDAQGVRAKIEEELRETEEARTPARRVNQRRGAPKNSATCCSRRRTGRGTSRWIRKKRCASPMRNSSGVFAPWKRWPRRESGSQDAHARCLGRALE